jgi:phospholipid/cholesterol/gamma-HCH transport system substrate-binding protein
MEARANHLWVGIVTLLLLAALAGGIVWMAQLNRGPSDEYDILYSQSVGGLAKGSQVSFSGVPVGQVVDIVVSDPQFVRVRIRVEEEVPILIGTTATIQSSFTGVASILLEGADKKTNPKISCDNSDCTYGKPIIPAGQGVLGKITADAPLILERLATVTERLNQILDEDNQAALRSILDNTNRLSGELANAAPRLDNTFAELEIALREAGQALDAFEKVTLTTDRIMNEEGTRLAAELRGTLKSANAAAASLAATLEDTRPAARAFRTETLPSISAALDDIRATSESLRSTSQSLRSVTERIDNQGIGGVVGSPALPDYKPKK